MEFKVIKRNGNAVVPDGMFKLCGMENVKLISMVQLNGGILLMPESGEHLSAAHAHRCGERAGMRVSGDGRRRMRSRQRKNTGT